MRNLINSAIGILGAVIFGESMANLHFLRVFDKDRFSAIVTATLLPLFTAVVTLKTVHSLTMRYFEFRTTVNRKRDSEGAADNRL